MTRIRDQPRGLHFWSSDQRPVQSSRRDHPGPSNQRRAGPTHGTAAGAGAPQMPGRFRQRSGRAEGGGSRGRGGSEGGGRRGRGDGDAEQQSVGGGAWRRRGCGARAARAAAAAGAVLRVVLFCQSVGVPARAASCPHGNSDVGLTAGTHPSAPSDGDVLAYEITASDGGGVITNGSVALNTITFRDPEITDRHLTSNRDYGVSLPQTPAYRCV